MITIHCGHYPSALKVISANNANLIILAGENVWTQREWSSNILSELARLHQKGGSTEIFTNNDIAFYSIRIAVKRKVVPHTDLDFIFHQEDLPGRRIQLNEDGHCEHFPEGFFDLACTLLESL